MAWDKAYMNCGVVKIESHSVKVFKDYASYVTISPPGKPRDARWSGDGVVITLDDGRVVKFSDFASYQYF